MKRVKIDVSKEDIKPVLYFIISMFQQETIHRQGTSSKSDLIGGFIDRWINKISEDLIFRKHLLLDKNYSVVNDYFIYGNQSKKNAPDILGLKINDKIIKFTEYDNNEWLQISGMPHIEIKTFRQNQRLVSVRDTQLEDDHYYIFVESDFNHDYLIDLFYPEFLDKEILDKIKMSDDFIKSNKQNILLQPSKISINKSDNIGTLEIITVVKGSEFKKRATRCKEKETVFYLTDIQQYYKSVRGEDKKPQKFKDIFQYNPLINMYETQWFQKKLIPFYAENIDELEILKKNKTNFYCRSSKECILNDYNLQANIIYKVDVELFDRNSSWIEYVALKDQSLENMSCEDELVILLDNIANNITRN